MKLRSTELYGYQVPFRNLRRDQGIATAPRSGLILRVKAAFPGGRESMGVGEMAPWPNPSCAELHRQMVARMLEPPSEELIEKTRETLESAGHSEEEIERFIAELRKPGLKAGQGFGGLHLEDVLTYLEVLFYQGAGRFTLEIEFENPDDDHLYLTIREIGRARWQEQEGS